MDPSRSPTHDILPEDDPERLRLLADGAHEPILIHDRGVLIDVNRAMCELLCGTREQLIGMDVREWLRSEDRDRVVGLAGGRQTLTQRFGVVRPGGVEIELEGTGSPVTYRGRECRIVRLMDIGRELEAERAANEWERVMRVNVTGVFLSVCAVLPSCGSRSGGASSMSPRIQCPRACQTTFTMFRRKLRSSA